MIAGLAPVSDSSAEILILGTMPGRASLAAQQYYEHGGTAFWKIMSEIVGFERSLAYDKRCARLIGAKIALWDVLQTCTRATSLDRDITDEVPNDFATYFARHPNITRVYSNGAKAAAQFKRHVKLDLARTLTPAVLPSTSAARTIAYAIKLAEWRDAIVDRSRKLANDYRAGMRDGRALARDLGATQSVVDPED